MLLDISSKANAGISKMTLLLLRKCCKLLALAREPLLLIIQAEQRWAGRQ